MCFLNPSDPLLKMCATEVLPHDIPLPATQLLIDQMYEIAHGEREHSKQISMVGLAAPQIGINKRIILVDVGVTKEESSFGELKVFINPKIIWHSPELIWDREECYSVDRRIKGVVPRFESIKLIAYNRYGDPIAEEISGMTARIVQHEIDHLEGVRFPDRVGHQGILHWVEPEESLHYKENWRNWRAHCSWHTWVTMKGDYPPSENSFSF